MDTSRQETIIIELDDPTPRWFRYGAIAITLVIAALVVAPWVIDVDTTSDVDANQPQQQVQSNGYAPVCQPTLDIPSFAEPAASMALPSWMRLCDWFAQPVGNPIIVPTEPADELRNED